jgi:hypothetical protein
MRLWTDSTNARISSLPLQTGGIWRMRLWNNKSACDEILAAAAKSLEFALAELRAKAEPGSSNPFPTDRNKARAYAEAESTLLMAQSYFGIAV